MNSVSLDGLKSVLTEDGFTILGHGTGSNNTEVIGKIFTEGLRASHTSIMYTTIGLDVDDMDRLEEKLNNWQHQDSSNVVLIKLPNEYFNMIGESMDLDCERTGAFVNERIDNQGNVCYYLDPKFIIGSYNRNVKQVILNPNYEAKLTDKSIVEMEEKLQKAVAKTELRLSNLEKSFDKKVLDSEEVTISYVTDSITDLSDLDWDDDFVSDQEEIVSKGR